MGSRSPWTCVLWDVDGTIVDASDGILRRLTITLEHFGKKAPTRAELVHWIGPPMFQSFQVTGGMSPDESAAAVAFYRVLGKEDGYTTGAKLFAGVGELIEEISAAGIPQATASSKPEIQVDALMDHFDLSPCFTAIVGATTDERTLAAKADIVAEALRRLEVAGVDTSRPVLVGDRHHDIEGGAARGVPVIFVRWGFSWPHEEAGAQTAVSTVDELADVLLIRNGDD
jgi:phosphoglycolate phosphatase